MKILGLDYGDKTVGVAVSDLDAKIAQPLFTVNRSNPIDVKTTIEKLSDFIQKEKVERVVIGMPFNMDGSEGERANKTRWFAKKLTKKINVDIVFCDERLSTFEASKILEKGGVKKSEQKRYIDKIAASIILQSYLDNIY